MPFFASRAACGGKYEVSSEGWDLSRNQAGPIGIRDLSRNQAGPIGVRENL